jgi:hypothetical protein
LELFNAALEKASGINVLNNSVETALICAQKNNPENDDERFYRRRHRLAEGHPALALLKKGAEITVVAGGRRFVHRSRTATKTLRRSLRG